tara:strand:+ start:106 stop:285 length:180 start_codon:yes stop_codon:yes gene_type:complete
MENVFDYRDEILKLNPEMSKNYATELAYEDYKSYIVLKEYGYSKNQAKQLAGAIRYGIY